MLAKVRQTKRLLKTKHHVEMGNSHIFTGSQKDCALVAKACNKSRAVLSSAVLPLAEALTTCNNPEILNEIKELLIMLKCDNCGEYFIYVLNCPSEIKQYEGHRYCSDDCMHEHNEMEDCAYCEETTVCEYSDERETYEGRTCSQTCHEEAMYLWGRNHGDPNYEHRTS